MKELTVLIIDDNELNLKLLRVILQIGRYRIVEAENAAQGLELAHSHHPDLILMGIQLPDMDGLTATRMLKNDPDLKEIPVVALTSYAMHGDDKKAFEAGCDAYITKPIDTRSFLETISQSIRES